jgi:bacterioferritin-associated ferredoxin
MSKMTAPRAANADQRPLCYCYDVSEADVRRHFEVPDATVDGLIERTKIGTRCTACLLDLDLVLESCHRTLGGAVDERAHRLAAEDGRHGPITWPADFTNSIFYVCDGTINTVIRVANYGIMFEQDKTVVDHSYSLFVFSNDGMLTARRRGEIAAQSSFEIDLAAIPGIAPHGWVLFALYPKQRGYRGSNRPYITFNAKGWTASVHMQRHSAASRRGVRNVNTLARESGEPLDAWLSVFNGSARPTGVRVVLVDQYGGYREEHMLQLPKYGAELVLLDSMFKPASEAEVFSVRVYSDEPTRKMIVNVHADKSWSIDHFPDFPNAL